MNLEELQNIAYSILLAKKDIPIAECARKAAKLGGHEGDDDLLSSVLIEFILGISSLRETALRPDPKPLLDEYETACKALATSTPYALAGHPVDAQKVIGVLRFHISGRMRGL